MPAMITKTALMMQTLLKQRVKTSNDNKSLTRHNIATTTHNFNFKIVTLMLYIVVKLMLYIGNLLLYMYVVY